MHILALYTKRPATNVNISRTLYNKITREYTAASYYRSSSKEMIYDMVKKQPPDSIELNNYKL